MNCEYKRHRPTEYQVNRLEEKITSLERENAELRKDKERLDWLNKNRVEHIYDAFKYHESLSALQDTWRRAIDAAMTKEEGK